CLADSRLVYGAALLSEIATNGHGCDLLCRVYSVSRRDPRALGNIDGPERTATGDDTAGLRRHHIADLAVIAKKSRNDHVIGDGAGFREPEGCTLSDRGQASVIVLPAERLRAANDLQAAPLMLSVS